jgi:hypothetical protein
MQNSSWTTDLSFPLDFVDREVPTNIAEVCSEVKSDPQLEKANFPGLNRFHVAPAFVSEAVDGSPHAFTIFLPDFS